MAGECQGRRSPPAGAGRPASRLSLLVGLAESFSSSLTPAEGSSSSSSRSPTARSPRSFDYEGAVGLGIVAAMNGGAPDPQAGCAAIARTPRTVAPRRSQPIPIVSARPEAFRARRKETRLEEEEEEEEMELSESYTCVISHVGGAAVSKRVYFDDGAGDPWGCCAGVFFDSPPPPRPVLIPAAEDFLSHCFRCSKDLHGVDIFMYRGDKAFCSAECRYQQIISDEQRGNRLPDSLKTFDCSLSPCSTPLLFAAGVAAV